MVGWNRYSKVIWEVLARTGFRRSVVWNMTNRTRTSLAVVAVVLGLAQTAHADLSAAWASAVSPSHTGSFSAHCPGAARVTPTPTETGIAMSRLSLGLPQDVSLPPVGLSDEEGDLSTQKVIELPPAPSSAALFLSALASAGAWHVCRSTKHLYVSGLPDWYHPDAPDRIGHVVVFDLDYSTAPLCSFEQPVGRPVAFYRVGRDHDVPHGDSQCFLTITSPRGPPSLSH